MLKRLSPTQWLVAALVLVGVVVGGEQLSRMVSPSSQPSSPAPDTTIIDPPEAAPNPAHAPAFAVGDPAPDFSLPDNRNVYHSLSSLVKKSPRKTLLCFACGCAKCLDVQTYLGILTAKAGPKAPNVISVTTMPMEQQAAWVRDTRLKQTILYESKGGPIMKQYRGHPCPRLYGLTPKGTVEWIGTSPDDVESVAEIGTEMAMKLGLEGAGMEGPPVGATPPAQR